MVAVARKPGLHPFFQACLDKYKAAFPQENEGWDFDWQYADIAAEGSRLARIAAARNYLADLVDEEDDVVMVLDADIVQMPFNLPSRLWAANPGGITAPLVLIEGYDRFYDTSGFQENGAPIRAVPFYFNRRREYFATHTKDGLVELDSVGCVYIAPAQLFRDGHRWPAAPSGLTDHNEFCAKAKQDGYKVACLTTVAAYHAALPLYGEQWRAKGE